MSSGQGRKLVLDALFVAEQTALAAATTVGRGDLAASDELAVEAMRKAFADVEIAGKVVIGEGEASEAPKLFVGEQLGRWSSSDQAAEIAVDPIEGTQLCAGGMPNAISVVALAVDGHFLPAADTYMSKIAVGPAGKGAIDLNQSVTWNLQSVADAKGVYVQDLTVVMLDRPRHEIMIREIREAGARIRLIQDGDVAAAIATCLDSTGIDMLVGIGGSAEGVLAAAALRCVGGQIVGRLHPRTQEERQRLHEVGITDFDRIYETEDMASGDVLFAASGITDGDFLRGVRFRRGGANTHTVVMQSSSMTVRFVEAQHHFDRIS